jgi:hypothetical protein
MNAFRVATALGGAQRTSGGGWLARCCCHKDRTPSLSLRDGEDGTLLVHCFAGCRAEDILAELRHRGLFQTRGPSTPSAWRPPPQPEQDTDAARIGYVQSIWNAAVDPRGTLGEKYLNGRGLELDDDLCMRVLRFHPRCVFDKDETTKQRIIVPALVLAFRPIRNDDDDKPPPAIHRIGLTRDGKKIDRKMLGPVTGCVIKLDPDDMVEEGLGIAEGFEKAMAVRQAGWHPMWCPGSAGRIAKLEPIPGIEALTIFADNDANSAGQDAARECAERWADAGCEVTITHPHAVGADWLDDLT